MGWEKAIVSLKTILFLRQKQLSRPVPTKQCDGIPSSLPSASTTSISQPPFFHLEFQQQRDGRQCRCRFRDRSVSAGPKHPLLLSVQKTVSWSCGIEVVTRMSGIRDASKKIVVGGVLLHFVSFFSIRSPLPTNASFLASWPPRQRLPHPPFSFGSYLLASVTAAGDDGNTANLEELHGGLKKRTEFPFNSVWWAVGWVLGKRKEARQDVSGKLGVDAKKVGFVDCGAQVRNFFSKRTTRGGKRKSRDAAVQGGLGFFP